MLPIIALFTALISFVATASAAEVASAAAGGESLLDLARPVLDALTGGEYLLGGALAVVFGVAAARKYLTPHVDWLGSKEGGASLALLGSFAAALATRLAEDPFSWGTLWTSLKVAIAAGGAYQIAKRLAIPLLRKAAGLLPGAAGRWATKAVDLLARLLARPLRAIERAEAAGDKAVRESPPSGISGVAGKPREVK